MKLFAILFALTASASAHAAAAYPFEGKVYEYRYGDFAVREHFVSASEMEFTILSGKTAGKTERVQYRAEQVTPEKFLISWQEKDGGTVVHLDDFQAGKSLSRYTDAKLNFHSMTGTLQPVK